MRRRRSRREAEAQPQSVTPSTSDSSDTQAAEDLDAALREVADRFLELTDQAENELEPDEPPAIESGWLGQLGQLDQPEQIDALGDAPQAPVPSPAAGSATATTTPGGAELAPPATEAEPPSPPDGEDAAGRQVAAEPARRRPQLRGRRRARRGAPATRSDEAPTGSAASTGPVGPTGRAPGGRWRQVRRVLPAALVVAALAVPGSGMLGGVDGLMRGSARGIEGELAAGDGGFPPFEEEPVDITAFEEPEQLEAVPVGEEPESESVQAVLTGAEVVETLGESGIPEVALQAYNQAADRLGNDDPACGIRWSLLAAIGSVESGHGQFGGARLREDGYGTKPIRGIPLNGRRNVALIYDTDDGQLDGDTTYDRAVGPMQFIPSTWASVGVDANDDGWRDPNNMFDATQGAAGYLCAGGDDLGTTDGQARAVRRYNNAYSYVQLVIRLARMYETGQVTPLPVLPALPGPPPLPPTQPSFDPGPADPAGPGPADPASPGPGQPAPQRPSTTLPAGPATPRPSTTTTAPPTTTTTVPPATTTTAPPSTTTVPPDSTTTTVPPVTTTVPPETPDAPDAPDAPAAVGWAPAMREVVVDILEDETPAPTTTAPPADPGAAAQPACDPPADTGPDTDDVDGNVPETSPECTGEAPADAPAAPPAGTGEAASPPDPATVPTT